MIAGALSSTDHPLLAHIIPVRRCNLACEYCNEFDDFSKPVPIETMFQRVDKLAALGTRLSPSAAASRCFIPNSTRSSPDSQTRHDRRDDHQWLSAGGRSALNA